MLAIKLLNEQATLNNYFTVESKEYTAGSILKLKFQVSDSENKTRLIAGSAGKCTCTFQDREGGEFDIEAQFLFGQDDRSMWLVTLDEEATMKLVGANFLVQVDMNGDEEDLHTGMAYNAISKITFDGEC